jgi:hypothetical protein
MTSKGDEFSVLVVAAENTAVAVDAEALSAWAGVPEEAKELGLAKRHIILVEGWRG